MSPYSATFAGRKIASGRVSLDLEYKIKNGKLEGNNKVLLDKFTLGERVEAPNALHLPLDLAIALLTDSQGQINVAIPVSGDVNNPKFGYGNLIWQAIATVIKNIVTAPFRALGALFGGGAAKLDAIAFDPGSARVLPTELDKLKKVAKALQQRPKLEVIVDGRYQAAVDGEALRSEKVRRELAAEQKVKLAPGEEPGPVAFDDARTQRALEKLMTARAGKDAMAQFTADSRKGRPQGEPRQSRARAVRQGQRRPRVLPGALPAPGRAASAARRRAGGAGPAACDRRGAGPGQGRRDRRGAGRARQDRGDRRSAAGHDRD